MSPKSSQEPPKIPPRGSQERAESLQDRLRSLQSRKKKSPRLQNFQKNALGLILATLCVPLAQLNCFWEPLGRSQATFPAIWGACMALRTHFGAPFRRHSCKIPCMHNPQQKSSTPSEPPHSQEFPHYGAAVSRQRLQSAAPDVYVGSEAFETKSEVYAEL